MFPLRTFFLVRLLFYIADFIVWAEGFKVVPPLDKMQACDELLGKLQSGSAEGSLIDELGGIVRPGRLHLAVALTYRPW